MPRKNFPQPDPDPDLGLPEVPGPVVQAAAPTFRAQQLLRKAIGELASRSCEALRLYEPLERIDRFHADGRSERLLRGSNRAGKTLGAAVEMARCVTGQDPYDKYPKRDGRAWLIGLDEQHLGEVMYRKLCRPGAFKMLRDPETGLWRSFRPVADAHLARLAKPAPPLIPRRFIADIAWNDKKRNIPRTVTLTTGWEMAFYSSKADPPQGSDIDNAWIDEEIENEGWFSELVARLLDRAGKLYWSATPQIASQQLYDLHVRAEQGDPNVGEHIALLEDNPHIPQLEKDKLSSRLSDEERRVRVLGEFALSGFKIYPNFSNKIHGLDMAGPPPSDWSLYMAVDPGRQVCAALFLAVPPHRKFVVVYDELYIKNCDARQFGAGVARVLAQTPQVPEAFIIDSHAGRFTDIGSGKNVEMQYRLALKRQRVRSARTGYGFAWGADDPKAGIEAVRDWLAVRGDGTTYLRVRRGVLRNFEWEVERYHYRKVGKQVSDEPEKKNDHLMDCLRYLCMFDPKWAEPKKRKQKKGYAVRALEAKRQRAKRRGEGAGFFRLGPGSAA